MGKDEQVEEVKKTGNVTAVITRWLGIVFGAALVIGAVIFILHPMRGASSTGCDIAGSLAVVTKGNIFTLNADLTDMQQISQLARSPSALAWSPDGKQIAFTFDQSNGARNIYLISSQGPEIRDLTHYIYPYKADDPTWSPDGKRIVFSLNWISAADLQKWQSYTATRMLTPGANKTATPTPPQTNAELFSMNADGTDQQNLTSSKATEFSPDWSHDGSHIIYTSTADSGSGQPSKLYIMNADGSGSRLLADLYSGDPKWSPDGESIVMVRPHQVGSAFGSGISIINADGTGLRDLVESATDTFSHPAWSSDGKSVAFEISHVDIPEIDIIDVASKHQCRLIAGDRSYTNSPSWKP